MLNVEGLLTFLIHSLPLMDCLDPESASSYKIPLTTVTTKHKMFSSLASPSKLILKLYYNIIDIRFAHFMFPTQKHENIA